MQPTRSSLGAQSGNARAVGGVPEISGVSETTTSVPSENSISVKRVQDVEDSRTYKYQPTRTANMETDAPSTPSTGNATGSDGVRAPITQSSGR